MATEKLELVRYDLSRTTAFTWQGTSEEKRYAKRAARALDRRLRELCAERYAPQVKFVRRQGAPQLVVLLTLPAESPEEAVERLDYYIDRASSTDVRNGAGGWVKVEFPWGETTVERVD